MMLFTETLLGFWGLLVACLWLVEVVEDWWSRRRALRRIRGGERASSELLALAQRLRDLDVFNPDDWARR